MVQLVINKIKEITGASHFATRDARKVGLGFYVNGFRVFLSHKQKSFRINVKEGNSIENSSFANKFITLGRDGVTFHLIMGRDSINLNRWFNNPLEPSDDEFSLFEMSNPEVVGLKVKETLEILSYVDSNY